ncbi:MAG: hypothetical protein ACREHG_09120 [Candidatus Saccharimonadales bacterium]
MSKTLTSQQLTFSNAIKAFELLRALHGHQVLLGEGDAPASLLGYAQALQAKYDAFKALYAGRDFIPAVLPQVEVWLDLGLVDFAAPSWYRGVIHHTTCTGRTRFSVLRGDCSSGAIDYGYPFFVQLEMLDRDQAQEYGLDQWRGKFFDGLAYKRTDNADPAEPWQDPEQLVLQRAQAVVKAYYEARSS